MRICIFRNNYEWGGLAKATLGMCDVAIEHGLEVDLIFRSGGIVAEAGKKDNVNLICLEKGLGPILSIKRCMRLIQYILSKKPEVFFVSEIKNLKLISIIKTITFSRTEIVLWMHEWPTLRYCIKKAGKKNIILGNVKGRGYKIIATWEYAKVKLLEAGYNKDDIEVIYNPIVEKDFHLKAMEPCDNFFNSNAGDLKMASVGRMDDNKNHELMVDAFSEVVKRSPAKFCICGGRTLEK